MIGCSGAPSAVGDAPAVLHVSDVKQYVPGAAFADAATSSGPQPTFPLGPGHSRSATVFAGAHLPAEQQSPGRFRCRLPMTCRLRIRDRLLRRREEFSDRQNRVRPHDGFSSRILQLPPPNPPMELPFGKICANSVCPDI